jgi:membrane protease YdiL (CAAX protease family)
LADSAPTSDDRAAAALRGFGPVGILAILVVVVAGSQGLVPVGALLVLAWARASRTPWGALGFARPRTWPVTVAGGVALGVALKLLMKSVVMPLAGAEPVNRAFQHLVGNEAALPWAIVAMIVNAGFGEETVYRGFLFERLGRLIGHAAWARVATVIVTASLFGLVHAREQGWAGALQAAIVGLVLGGIYAVTRRIWLPMIAHAAFDLTALAIIYADLEEEVARAFFR